MPQRWQGTLSACASATHDEHSPSCAYSPKEVPQREQVAMGKVRLANLILYAFLFCMLFEEAALRAYFAGFLLGSGQPRSERREA